MTTKTETGINLTQGATSAIITGMMDGAKRRNNHAGCLTRRGEGKPWICRWMYKGKIHTKSTRTTDEKKAYKILAQLTRSYCYEEPLDVISALENQLKIARAHVAKPEIPVENLWTVYEEMQEWGDRSEKTKLGYERMIRALSDWMKKHGCRNVSDLTNEKALQLCKELQDNPRCGAATYNNRLSQYKLVWKTVARSYNVQADAWEGRGYMKAKDSRKKPFTREELRKLLAAADEDMKLLILIGAYTGMRKEDCATLKWEDVDMERKTLFVIPEKTKKHGNKVKLNIAPELYEALVEAKKKATGEYVNERNARGVKRIGERFGKLLDKCEIKRTEKDEKGRTRSVKGFHSLRHFTASALYAAGMSKADVARVLADSEEMMDTYIDVNFGTNLAA